MTNVFYFKVNLNKYGEMKLQAEKENRAFRTTVIVYLIGAILMFAGYFFLNNSLQKKIENRKDTLKKLSGQLSQYENQEDFLSVNDLNQLAQTFNNRIFWTRKLEALSREIDPQVAIKKFSYTNGVLTLNGIIEVKQGIQEGDVIFNFIQRLKANPDINNDFPEIKSGSALRQIAQNTEILEFAIECYSRESAQLRGRK